MHPNSTAARKWGRTHWLTSRNLYAEASAAEKSGDLTRAKQLRAKAAREGTSEIRC